MVLLSGSCAVASSARGGVSELATPETGEEQIRPLALAEAADTGGHRRKPERQASRLEQSTFSRLIWANEVAIARRRGRVETPVRKGRRRLGAGALKRVVARREPRSIPRCEKSGNRAQSRLRIRPGTMRRRTSLDHDATVPALPRSKTSRA